MRELAGAEVTRISGKSSIRNPPLSHDFANAAHMLYSKKQASKN